MLFSSSKGSVSRREKRRAPKIATTTQRMPKKRMNRCTILTFYCKGANGWLMMT